MLDERDGGIELEGRPLLPLPINEEEEEPCCGVFVGVGPAWVVGVGCGDDEGEGCSGVLLGLGEVEDEEAGVEDGVVVVLGGSVDEAGVVETRK